MAPLEKASAMKRNARWIAAGMVAILSAMLQVGAALPASPEAEPRRSLAVGKQKHDQTNRTQPSPSGKTRPRIRAQPEIREAKDEPVLCDGVPFGPHETPAAAADRRR